MSSHESKETYAKWTNKIKSPKSALIQFQSINRVNYGAPCRKDVKTDLQQYRLAIKTTGKKFGLNENLLNFKVRILNQAVSLANITF
ncbi:hypothetical protein AAW12_04960 [Sphingobacterium sp. Ag1]|nr:hypothetical protein AAW12_04960 [Sphingobacterium sp. Ag1]